LSFDFVFRPLESLDIKGFASLGNWEYKGNVLFKENLMKSNSFRPD
jgi:hypothetical protein